MRNRAAAAASTRRHLKHRTSGTPTSGSARQTSGLRRARGGLSGSTSTGTEGDRQCSRGGRDDRRQAIATGSTTARRASSRRWQSPGWPRYRSPGAHRPRDASGRSPLPRGAVRALTSLRRLDELRADARYHRDCRDLYRAEMYGPRPASLVQLKELERDCVLSEARLRRAEQELQAETVRLRALAE